MKVDVERALGILRERDHAAATRLQEQVKFDDELKAMYCFADPYDMDLLAAVLRELPERPLN
jgi:hypothetical protein